MRASCGWVWLGGVDPNDRALLQFAICVALLLMLDAVGTLGAAYQGYTYFVTEWGNVAYLESEISPWGFDINPMVVGLSAFIVQSCASSVPAARLPADQKPLIVYACDLRCFIQTPSTVLTKVPCRSSLGYQRPETPHTLCYSHPDGGAARCVRLHFPSHVE